MSTSHDPNDFDVNYHADLQWRRQQMALKSLEPGDVLAEVDDLIAQEPDPEPHPLYAMVAYNLDRRVMPGAPEGLWARYRRLIDHAVERLVEQQLADPRAREVGSCSTSGPGGPTGLRAVIPRPPTTSAKDG